MAYDCAMKFGSLGIKLGQYEYTQTWPNHISLISEAIEFLSWVFM